MLSDFYDECLSNLLQLNLLNSENLQISLHSNHWTASHLENDSASIITILGSQSLEM